MKQEGSEGLVGRGRGQLARSERRVGPARRLAVIIKEALARALERRRWGECRATIIGAQSDINFEVQH